MTKSQTIKCNSIIHAASVAAAAVGAGLAQLPCSDCTVIIPIQTAMSIGLAGVFGFELSEGAAKAAVASATAATVGRSVSQWMIGWVPVAGNIINATTAAGITEAIGWILAAEYERKASLSIDMKGA